MSGEKSGTVRVEDYRKLASSEEADASNLNDLETRRVQGETLSEDQERRRVALEKRVSRRRQREDAGKRRQVLRAEEKRRRELEIYGRRRAQFQEAVARQAGLEQQYPGIKLPPPPAITEPDSSSIDSIRAAVAKLDKASRDYDNELKSTRERYQQEQAVRNAGAEVEPGP